MKKFFPLIILVIIFLSCTDPKNILSKAKKYQVQNKYDNAERLYLRLIIKYPTDDLAAEAMYNLGLIYKDVKKDYPQSKLWFSQIITKFPYSDFKDLAQVGMLDSPDYFGLNENNTLLLGDPETGGKNMRIKNKISKLDYNLFLLEQTLFAGEKVVRVEKRYYLKTGTEIREFLADPTKNKNAIYSVVLKLPYEKNNFWQTKKDGKNVTYTIVEDNVKIKIKDKEFVNCIKVMEQVENSVGIKYLYYAPNVGCVKITTTTILQKDKEYVSVQGIF